MTELASNDSRSLIDELLEEQRLVTAVTRFAQKHDSAESPLQSRYYRDLLPLEAPGVGEQYAFEVDLDQCSGCKACVAACHSLNGLEAGESWRAVGLLVSDEAAAPLQQTVTTACHHCVDPGCLNGCPVLAYEKDAVTGIVRHLDDQCIGCQYCVLKCPYEVPRYSSRLGIVRKCDMCANRLAVGEAPACVQSCPSSAIRITVVNKEVVRQEHSAAQAATSSTNSFLPETPDPSYTIPTTRFVSARGLPATMRAADAETVHPAAPHWPLVFMLVLTQAGIGAVWFEAFSHASITFAQQLFSAALIFAGLGTSILHLGRPLQAWRAFTGVRRSWLSREILAFNIFALGVLLHLAAGAWPASSYGTATVEFCSLAGAAALICSMMVYIDTPREFWRWPQTVTRFAGTTLLLGAAIAAMFNAETKFLLGIIAGVALGKIGMELAIFRHLSEAKSTALKRTAKLMAGDLKKATVFRFASLTGGAGFAMFLFLSEVNAAPALAVVLFALLFASELAERFLFFSAVAQPKMPGGMS
jgi:formate dehydrogenase iron-sulfur subunit